MRPDPSIHPFHSPYSQLPFPLEKAPKIQCAGLCSFIMYFSWFAIMTSWILTGFQGELNNDSLIFELIMFGIGTPFFVFGTCCCCYIRRVRSRHRKRMKEYSQGLERMRSTHQSNLPIQVMTPAENLVNRKVLLI